MVTTWVVIATGASLGPEAVARARHLPCIAVGNAYALAPWAKALVACDVTWWQKHPEAKAFPGDKWCMNGNRVKLLPPWPGIFTNTNSGLLGLHCAVNMYGAKRVLLLGIDMKGTHYFGRYRNGCANTEPDRFALFIRQFEDFAKRLPKGVEIINCSMESALQTFPKMSLDDALMEVETA